jgi:hypothetical protein
MIIKYDLFVLMQCFKKQAPEIVPEFLVLNK